MNRSSDNDAMTSTKRPGNHETMCMTLAMLDMIPKTGKISAPEIHERLQAMGIERDLRSIQRQLVVLAEQFPLDCDDSSKPHGYKWKQGAEGISIPSLTLHESLLLNMAENYLRSQGQTRIGTLQVQTPVTSLLRDVLSNAYRPTTPTLSDAHLAELNDAKPAKPKSPFALPEAFARPTPMTAN